MAESTAKPPKRRGRILPERTLLPEELARRKAEDKIFLQLCRSKIDRVHPDLIKEHYGWYIAIKPNSGDYFIDAENMQAHKKALEKYPNTDHCVFCVNETGTTDTI